ncbi:MAG: putative DNA binding domain-containing protein [Succinivibrionaceae bacterium]|nr:putative DNA binding domain-containing protein [Succinivibrionaceae bacterium]
MQTDELKRLIKEVHQHKTEKQTIELKAAQHGFPGKIYDTLSSFSNQDDGGIIIFGITDKPEFKVVGVYDAEDTQKKIMEACDQMEPKVRALITMCEIDGNMVVAAEIPGTDQVLRPVFYRGAGRLKGSYIRVGDADEPMSEYEVYSYEAFRRRTRDELRTAGHIKLSLFDQERLSDYMAEVKAERKNLSNNVPEEDILELMGITSEGQPTIAGIMTFSRYPQTYFPQLCITAVVVPGTQIGDTDDDGARFIDNKRITGAIPEMVEDAVEFVRRNSRTKTIIDDDGRRNDRPEYPIKAVREVILNALIHRDYSVYSENSPVSLEMYRDRMVVRNRGGLYGGGSVKQLGKGRSETRNAALANMLELLHVTENRYSGIPTILREMEAAGLPEPKFEIRRGDFEVTLINNIFVPTDEIDKTDITAAILVFCKTPRSRKELVEFTGKSQYYTMSAIVQPLISAGKIRYTIPEKPKSPKQRFEST